MRGGRRRKGGCRSEALGVRFWDVPRVRLAFQALTTGCEQALPQLRVWLYELLPQQASSTYIRMPRGLKTGYLMVMVNQPILG